MTYKHSRSSSDAHTEVLYTTLPGICTTCSADAAQKSTGLMPGNANATQGSKLHPLLTQRLNCKGDSRSDMNNQPCTKLDRNEVALFEHHYTYSVS